MSILLAALLVFAITPILSESVHATPQNGGTRSGQLKNLTLKSDGIGGTAATGYSGVAGTKVSLYAEPGDGHRFLKWEILSGEGSIDNPGSAGATFTFGATDAVVQAIFTEAEQDETYVVVIYHFAEGTATATVDPNDPTTYYLIATPADGCTFSGWSNMGTGTGTISDPFAASTTITGCSGRIEVGAHFDGNPIVPVTITANPTAGGTAEASWKNVYSSLDVDLKATPSVGYVFKEWRIKSGTGAIRNPNEAFTVLTGITGNVSCEAVFEAISSGQYGVSLTKNKPEGGEATASVASGPSGTTVVLTAAPASGFRFEKWEVKAGGVTIDNPTNETATFNIGSDHVSVEACFKEERFSVTAIAEGGGKASKSNDNALPGVYIWLDAYDQTGVHFSHWEVISGDIVLGNAYNQHTSFIMGNKNVEVKAVFVPEDTYCVRITNDGHGTGNPEVQSGKTGDTVTLTAAPNAGYIFKEWMVITRSGGTLSSTTANPAQFTIGTGHATIRATFIKGDYNITYELNGGTNAPANPVAYKSDTLPITFAAPTWDGYTFDGWYDNASFSGSPVTGIPVNSTGDKTFWAKWTETPHQHDWKPATCTEPKTCKTCGATEGKALGHKWDAGKVTKAATEKAEGVKTFTCTVCKATKTETIPKLEPSIPKISGTPTAKMTAKGSNGLTIGWNKIQGAAGYDIFFAECNHNGKKIACKNVKNIKGNKTFSWSKTGLKKNTAYKAYVKAYVMKNGKKSYVRTSPMMHAYTGGQTKNYTNAKSVTIKNVKKGKLSLKKGKTYTIKATVNKVNKKKKLMSKSHAPILRYMTSNSKVATVNSSGKITAKGKGTCYIYAYAHNGVSKSIKVTVN